jgi:predicted methyltransferase
MLPAEMDATLGLKHRMRKVANNLRKFGMLEGETAKLSDYHIQMTKDGLDVIAEKGVRKYAEELGKMCGVSASTIRSDYSIMKRYGVIK